MNNLNYASFEASKKLHDAGIVLETDYYWCLDNSVGWYLRDESTFAFDVHTSIPAPCFTEVWTVCKKQPDGITKAYTDEPFSNLKVMFNTNPTDALIELLIWAKGEKK